MSVSVSGDGIIFPSNTTTANRPTTPSAGATRYNNQTKSIEFYDGSRWALAGFPGSNSANPATTGEQIYDAGVRGKGFFWFSSPNGGTVLNYCDLDTVDQYGKAGWILVAMFPNYNWYSAGYSTRATLDPTSLNMNINAQNDAYTRKWSANWGDYTMNRFRLQFADSVGETGSAAKADFYFNWSNACTYKEIWNYKAGTGNWFCGSTGDNAGNLNAPAHAGLPAPNPNTDPQPCFRGFNWAYNLKFGVQVAQNWNSFIDNSGDTASNGTYDFWGGLRNPGYTLGYDLNGDGSIGILYYGSAFNHAGQDRQNHNAKFGIDDTAACALWSDSATTDRAEAGVTDIGRPLFFWIK